MCRIARLLIAFALIAPAACGESGGGDPRVAGSSARPTPDDGGIQAMQPGEYRSSVFRPQVTFRIEQPFWQKEYETKDRLSLWGLAEADADYDEGSIIDVFRPFGIYDPTKPRTGRPWPRDMVAFLRGHPHLRTTAPRRAEVAGRPAQVLDLRPRREVQLWLDSAEQQHYLDDRYLVRVFVIDAGAEQRLVVLTIPREKGTRGFAPLERIVHTLRFAAG